jgi:hypothetical protein
MKRAVFWTKTFGINRNEKRKEKGGGVFSFWFVALIKKDFVDTTLIMRSKVFKTLMANK